MKLYGIDIKHMVMCWYRNLILMFIIILKIKLS